MTLCANPANAVISVWCAVMIWGCCLLASVVSMYWNSNHVFASGALGGGSKDMSPIVSKYLNRLHLCKCDIQANL